MSHSIGRDRQLSWLIPGATIKQDQDLIDFIRSNGFKQCYAMGDAADYFRTYIDFVKQGPVDFCLCIQNSDFDLDDLINDTNSMIAQHLSVHGRVYLSFNRYQIRPKRYGADLSEDFDTAIAQHVTRNIHARVDSYIACGEDAGNKFNWVHPLTRFYLSKKHDS